MQRTVDARGMACPQPVICAKKALAEEGVQLVTVIVDNDVARDNVAKLAKSLGYEINVQKQGEDYVLEIIKEEGEKSTMISPEEKHPAEEKGTTVLLVASDSFGKGSEELGGILLRMFYYTLTEVDSPPDTLLLLNGGVKTAIRGAETLPLLENLAASGVKIFVCGTCLDYFGLREKLGVGSISNMYAITEIILQARKVISIT